MEMDLITRRQFIKKTGLATGALLFSGSLMSGKKYKKEKDIAGKSKKRDACDAGPAAVFGDFADELGGGERDAWGRTIFLLSGVLSLRKKRSGTKFGDTASVIPTLSAGVF